MKDIQVPEKITNLKDWNTKEMVESAQKIVNSLNKGLHTQLRKIFGSLRKLELQFNKQPFSTDELILLKYRLAYAASRSKELNIIRKELDKAIDKVSDQKDFKKLVNFMEAIVAYYKHKFPAES